MESRSVELIHQIETLRNSRVIAYLTSDQVNSPFVARMALDVVPFFYEHLRHVGKPDRLDLFLYSQGGDTIVPWRLVNLARERCSHLAVLIPYKAHSAATLLALGADEIVMGELGELSPIDPSITTPFNPRRGDQPDGPLQEISVEDVTGFFDFAKDRLGISSESNLTQALQLLIGHLHPLALGGVYRSHALIRLIAAKLLALHMTQATDKLLIDRIVDDLAEKLYYHNYVIGRQQAQELGLNLVLPPEDVDIAMWELFQVYREEMDLGGIFDPSQYLGDDGDAEIDRPIALLESSELRSCFRKQITIHRQTVDVAGKQELALEERNIPWHSEVRANEEGT